LIKKIAVVLIFVLLLFAGIIALTQETDEELPLVKAENEFDGDEEFFYYPEAEKKIPDWLKDARWFRSNAGGMAIEEIPSRLMALRNEYALVIDSAQKEDLPESLLPFYDERYFMEIRVLFKKGEQSRTQWVFRDEDGRSRLVAVFIEKETADEMQPEPDEAEDADGASNFLTIFTDKEEADGIKTEPNEAVDAYVRHRFLSLFREKEVTEEIQTELNEALDADGISELLAAFAENEITDGTQEDDFDGETDGGMVKTNENKNSPDGFIEIYDENLFLSAEYRFFQDGGRSRTDFAYKDDLLISSTFLLWEENDGVTHVSDEQYVQVYTDYFRYNRSLYLRSVRRVFYKDREISSFDEPVVIAFPSGILAAARETAFIGERQNSYPEFFGEITAKKDSAITYSTDEKGRVLSQTFFDEEGNVIWAIYNTWSDDRIVSTAKEEGDNISLAEYEYDSGGDRVLERNYTNGVLNRVVRSEGKTDIEELYLNGNVILRAVWEDGRKISETMMR